MLRFWKIGLGIKRIYNTLWRKVILIDASLECAFVASYSLSNASCMILSTNWG